VAMDTDGMVYVCDRRGHRIQVFDKMGEFRKNIPVEFTAMSPLPSGPDHIPGALGSAVSVGFSRDAGQKYMYVVNQDNEKVDILDRASGKLLTSFGRVGRQPGEFTYSHFLAVDSKGNIYVSEVGTGKRIQKFKLVK
jgi:DNA-binding beta-propeller fold protein YncE